MAYSYKMKVAQAGDQVDMSLKTDDSFVAGEDIQFGEPLMRGNPPDQVAMRFNGSLSTGFLGIAKRDPRLEKGYYSANTGVTSPDMVAVATFGRIWVPLVGAQTIVAGDNAYVETSNDTITNQSTVTTITIGTFLSGGVNVTGKIFKLELQPGFEI